LTEEEKIQQRDDWRWVVSTRSGRRIIGGILQLAGVWRSSFVQSDRGSTEYCEGMRAVGLKIYQELEKHDPDMLFAMLKEAHDRRQEAHDDSRLANETEL
jgi:hypothetical protein